MSFHFQQKEAIERGVHRIARAQIDQILVDLGGRRRQSRDKAIHESRKRLKRLRALLRLLRDGMGRAARRKANGIYRDAGRSLSASRDAKVIVDALDGLLEHSAGRIEARAVAPFRARLLARHRAAQREHRRQGVQGLAQSLRKTKQVFSALKLKQKGFASLRGGLKHTFCLGRKAFETALYDRDSEKLHAWRKRVKDLLHQIELLTPIWPDVLEQLGEKIHALADCLGEDHDLALLRRMLIDSADPAAVPDERDALIGAIDSRRSELQQAAMQLGLRVYGEKPAIFIERMENYWNAWRQADA